MFETVGIFLQILVMKERSHKETKRTFSVNTFNPFMLS
jgi:hypothetical protein